MKKKQKETIYGPTREIAEATGYSIRRIQQFINEGAPATGRNKIHKADFYLWLRNKERLEFQEKLESSVSELDRARTRKENEAANKLEMENAIKREKLVTIEDHNDFMQKLIITIKSKLLAFPNKYTNEILSSRNLTEAKTKAMNGIKNILQELGEGKTETGRAVKKKTKNIK